MGQRKITQGEKGQFSQLKVPYAINERKREEQKKH
jgi:hypothetical protein